MERERNRQVARIGNNLNQIARWANTHRSEAEAVEVIAHLVAIEARKEQVAFVHPGLRVKGVAGRDVSFGCRRQPVGALVRVERDVDPRVLGRGDVGAEHRTLFGRQLRREPLPSPLTVRGDQLTGSDQAVSGSVLPGGVARWRHER